MSYCFQSIGCEKKHQQRGDQVDEHCDREGAQPVQWEQGLARAHRWRRHALSVSQVRWLCVTLLFDKKLSSLNFCTCTSCQLLPVVLERFYMSVRVLLSATNCAFRFSVVAMGVLRWVDFTVSDTSYFNLNTDHTPLHLILLDEVRTH